ncbi:calcium-transporting ATPase 4, plasma membrane-type-like protein [Tanacetum coccineum]
MQIDRILSPINYVADTYGALIPEGTPSEFQRILELKYPLNYLRKWALESTKGRQKTRIMGKLNHATCLDTLGALPLATEPPNDGLMNKPPVKRTESFITKTMK